MISALNGKTLNFAALDAEIVRLSFLYSPRTRAETYEMLAALVKNGKPLTSAIAQIRDRYIKKKRPGASLLIAWSSAMSHGRTLADALRGYVPETESVVIAAGEKSDDMHAAFLNAASVARGSAQMFGAVFAEMSMPVMLFFMLIGLVVGFATQVAPDLVKAIPIQFYTPVQRSLFQFSGHVNDWYVVGLILLLVMVVVIGRSITTYVGKYRYILDKLPPWSIYRAYSSASFMISLSALIRSGVPIAEAVGFVRTKSSVWTRGHLGIMLQRLRAGLAPGDAMDTGMLTDLTADLIALYSGTTDFHKAMSGIGAEAINDGVLSIRKKAAVMRLISLITVGGFVLWIAVSLVTLGQAANNQSRESAQGASRAP